MKPKSRLPWAVRKMSVMNDQKTDTTKRLKTLVQMKKIRPIQMFAASGASQRSAKKISRFDMKKRYVRAMNRILDIFETAVVKRGWRRSIPARVPV